MYAMLHLCVQASGEEKCVVVPFRALTRSGKVPGMGSQHSSVPKKDGKVRMCVDYRDLNWANPKDNFPLPHINTLVDNTANNS